MLPEPLRIEALTLLFHIYILTFAPTVTDVKGVKRAASNRSAHAQKKRDETPPSANLRYVPT
jgi:hypothetical protein